MTAPRARIFVLCDNEARPGFAAEWGLSLLVETPAGHRVLWDAGQSDKFLGNAARLGQDLSGLDAAALSHGHYDHGNGFPLIVERTGFSGPAYAHPGHGVARFSHDADGEVRSIGLAPAACEALAGCTPVNGSREIVPGLVMLADIPRREGLSSATSRFFLDREGSTPDSVPDDACLVLDTAEGPVLVLGCCHSGLANTLLQVRDVLGHTRLAGVVGGLHLYGADEATRAEARVALRDCGAPRLVPGHCTGRAATRWLAGELPGRVEPLAAGSVLEF